MCVLDLVPLLTSAGAWQSPPTAPTGAPAGVGNTPIREIAQVVDALTAFQCSVADLEIGNISVKISFSRPREVRNQNTFAAVRAGTCCYSVTQTQWLHGLTVSL